MLLVPKDNFLPLCRRRVQIALSNLLNRCEISLNTLMNLGFSRKSAWQTIKALKASEFIVPHKWGRYKANEFLVRNEKILLNPNDAMLELILKSKYVRRVLKAALRYAPWDVKGLASLTGASLRSVLRAIDALKSCRIMGEEGSLQFIYKPERGVELLPRSFHREVMEHFLKCLENYGSLGFTSAVVVFGSAADGLLLQPIRVACMVSLTQKPQEYLQLAFTLNIAKDNVKSSFNVDIDPAIVVENAYLAAKLDILASPNPLLTQITQGLCIFGRTPEKEEYFDILNKIAPLTEGEVKEKLEKGYIKAEHGHYIFTDKALNAIRSRAPTNINETYIPVNGGKQMKFITVGGASLP
ncbi:MAG: hypothetical protein QXO20_06240 [Candidatus Bathyarchaeia archaeon]